MKAEKDITIILDRSGSMESIKRSTIEGFNTFLNNQKHSGSRTYISLIQFDDRYELNYTEQDIASVNYLNRDTFRPRGLTALLDAIGTTIDSTEKRLFNKEENQRPDNVIIVILTDGLENASSRYTRNDIFNKIRNHEERDNWEFVFLAANQDAIHEARGYGIAKDKALTFSADSNGIKDSFDSLSRCIDKLDLERKIRFLKEDRDRQKR